MFFFLRKIYIRYSPALRKISYTDFPVLRKMLAMCFVLISCDVHECNTVSFFPGATVTH